MDTKHLCTLGSVVHTIIKHNTCTLSKSIIQTSNSKRTFLSRNKYQLFETMEFQEYPPKPSGIPGILFQRSNPKHLKSVQKLLRDSFFKDEPIINSLGLSESVDVSFIEEEARLILEQLSIVAIDENSNEIVGAAINRSVQPQELIEWPKDIEKMSCLKTQKLAKFWYNISTTPNIFQLFNVKEFFEITFLVTHKSFRGKHLAEKLTHESLLLAKETNQVLILIYCTNYASARIASKLGMKIIGMNYIKRYFIDIDKDFDDSKLIHPNDKLYIYATTPCLIQPKLLEYDNINKTEKNEEIELK